MSLQAPGSSIHVVVADDRVVVRVGVRALLRRDRDIEIVGEVTDGREVVSRVKALAPQVLLLDVAMANTVATKLARHVRRLAPAVKILVFSGREEPFYIQAMLDSGVHGYLSQRASENLALAIRAVSRGERYLCTIATASIDASLAADLADEEATDASFRNAVVALSSRERDVLRLLGQGHTSAQIAATLGIGVNSVGTYRARVAKKLGAPRRADLVRAALASGLIARAVKPGSQHRA